MALSTPHDSHVMSFSHGVMWQPLVVTPPAQHPKWMLSGGVTLRDYDSLTFSFSELTPAFICTNSVIKKFFFAYIHYTYHHSGIHYILYPYTRVPLLVLLQFTITKLYIKSEIAEQCGEHLSLRWPALLMWNVLSSILVFCFCTYTD